jgi:AraC-like DNA-binding protein
LKFKNFSNKDCTEFEHSISISAKTYQTSPGRNESERRCFILPELAFFYRKENLARLTVLFQESNQYLLIVPLTNLIVNGISHSANELIIINPSDITYCTLPENFSCVGVSFSSLQVKNHLSAIALHHLKVAGKSKLLGNPLKLDTSSITNYILQTSKPLTFQNYQTGLENQSIVAKTCFELINNTFNNVLESSKNRAYQSRKNIVDRAFNFFVGSDITDVAIPELAEQCYCSVRSLEYAFKSILQMTPKRFVTLRKYHLVRQSIKKQGSTSMKSLLQQFGLTNQGRFTLQYEALFGESPKMTWDKTAAISSY